MFNMNRPAFPESVAVGISGENEYSVETGLTKLEYFTKASMPIAFEIIMKAEIHKDEMTKMWSQLSVALALDILKSIEEMEKCKSDQD